MEMQGRQDHRSEMPESLQPAAAAAFLNGPMFGALARGSEAYSRALLNWQSELLRFATSRLRTDTEFGRSLVGVRDWTDATRLQQSWLNNALQDYIDEAGRLFRLAAGLSSDVAETSRQEVEQVAERGADWAKRASHETANQARQAADQTEETVRRAGRAAARSQPRRRQRRS
jgi:ElaB/YqjD/DUF883 family membrane-anchored ribosome-binding protein